MLSGEDIAEADPTDGRKPAQGLYARYLVDGTIGARLVAAVGEAGHALGHHPTAAIGHGHVDLKSVSADATYRDNEGIENVVEWVAAQDVDLAGEITAIAADHRLQADPASVSEVYVPAVVAAGATVVDDSQTPSLTVIADRTATASRASPSPQRHSLLRDLFQRSTTRRYV